MFISVMQPRRTSSRGEAAGAEPARFVSEKALHQALHFALEALERAWDPFRPGEHGVPLQMETNVCHWQSEPAAKGEANCVPRPGVWRTVARGGKQDGGERDEASSGARSMAPRAPRGRVGNRTVWYVSARSGGPRPMLLIG